MGGNGARSQTSKWKEIKGATTAPLGYKWVSNGKSHFSKDYKAKIVKDKKAWEGLDERRKKRSLELIKELKSKGVKID